MPSYEFKKATKAQSKYRGAIYGPSGSGKTWTSLAMATGFVADEPEGRIALIDTERGSASLYGDKFDFAVLELTDKSVESYTKAIAAGADYVGPSGVLIIDSLSHGWHELLQEINKLAKTKYHGNSWAAWNEGTPLQRMMIDAILQADCHIIATMRSKTVWEQQESNGRKQYVRIGLDPEQGKGIEYEFTTLLSIGTDHTVVVEKDRTGRFQDNIIEKPGIEFGAEIKDWLKEGAALATEEQKEQIVSGIHELMGEDTDINSVLLRKGKAILAKITEAEAADLLKDLEKARTK